MYESFENKNLEIVQETEYIYVNNIHSLFHGGKGLLNFNLSL